VRSPAKHAAHIGSMKTPDVSVIVPAHRDSPALRRCLAALAVQECPADRFEVVVVLNGARPPAPEQFDGPGELRVRAVHEPTPGSYSARNRGLLVARGDTLAFTDSDCVPDVDWVTRGMRALTRGDADIVAGKVRVTFASDDPRDPVSLFERCFAFRQDAYVRWGFGATANLITSRRVVEAAGPFESRLLSGGDIEWCFRARRLGFRLEYASDVVVTHPARTTYRDLFAKAQRVAGGMYTLARLHPELVLPRSLRVQPIDVVYPRRVLQRIRKDPRLRSTGERLTLLLVVQAILAARVVERCRLTLGGSPLRF
jgi:glycosyltransferase involved in cell wall biosynthesis